MEYMESKMQDQIEGGIRYVEHLEQVNAALVSVLEEMIEQSTGCLAVPTEDCINRAIRTLKLAKGE